MTTPASLMVRSIDGYLYCPECYAISYFGKRDAVQCVKCPTCGKRYQIPQVVNSCAEAV